MNQQKDDTIRPQTQDKKLNNRAERDNPPPSTISMSSW